MIDLKEFTILAQNILNRATEIELSTAERELRIPKIDNIKSNFSELKNFVGIEIVQFLKKNPDSNKPKFTSFKKPFKRN